MTLRTLVGYSAAGSDMADRTTFGPVHVDVTDGERALLFWQQVVGLTLLGRDGGALHLGVPGRDLLVLHPGATGPTPRGHSGLYHLALHLPNAGELARAVARIAAYRVPQGPTDHIMSLATYLNDADGIGLELTLETPHRLGARTRVGDRMQLVDADGRPSNGREPIDLDFLFDQLPDDDLRRPLPPETTVGHVHLHVADLAAAEAFYRDVVGFTPRMRSASSGMADLSAGGSFEHRLALNVWQGEGAPPRPPGTAGLRHFEIVFRDPAELDGALARAAAGGHPAEPRADGTLLRDPAGNVVLLSA